jgi:dolichol kinase
MEYNIINALAFGGVFLALFIVAEAIYWKHNVEAEWTRKMVHIVSGLISLQFPLFLDNHWVVLVLCTSFAGVLYLSYRYNFLPSINRVDRVTHGSLLFPLVIYICYFAFQQSGSFLFYYLPILILAISDPLAAITGKSIPIGPYMIFGQNKTLMGSGAFFVSAFACSFIAFWRMEASGLFLSLLAAFFMAMVTTTAEAVTHKGYDNLIIPISGISALLFIQYTQLF